MQTIWVCEDCMFTHANGQASDDPNYKPDREPLNLIQDYEEVSLGMALSEHGDECIANGEPTDNCECEQITFSSRPCDGCGSNLAGTRHAMTLWQKGE